MPAPHTPQVTVDVGFGYSPADAVVSWQPMDNYRPHDVTVSRGRANELDRFSPARAALELVDTTDRDLDPTNLSGPYVTTDVTTEFPLIVGSVVSEAGTSLGTDNAQTLPTGVTVGELLVAYVTVDSNGSGTGISLGTGSAVWTELFDAASGTIVRHAAYARIATGSDALVLTGPTQDYVCQIIRIGKHGCATTADIEVGTTATGTDGFPDPTTLSGIGVQKWLWLVMAGVDCTTTTTVSVSEAGDFTEIGATVSAVSTSSVGLAWGSKEDETDSNGTSPIAISGPRDWVCAQIAVPPESTSTDRTLVTTNTPIRVVATMPAAETVLDDPATGPDLHSAWRVTAGAITGTISGSYPLAPLVEMVGPAYNWDGESSFQFGTVDEGSSPEWIWIIRLASGGYIGFYLNVTTLAYLVNDGATTVDDTVVWNDTNHRYLRVRFDGDDVAFERSANGSSWTTIDTYTRGIDFASSVDWSYGYLYVGVTAGSPSFDDFLVEVSSTTLFRGAVDAWTYRPLPGHEGAMVQVSAVDDSSRLANTELPQRWQEAVLALAPDAWYPLGERDSATAYDATRNGYDGIIPTTIIAQGEPPVTPVLGNGSIRLHHNYPPYFRGVRLPDSLRRTGYPFTLNMWVQTDGAVDTNVVTLADGTGQFMLCAQGQAGGTTGDWFYVEIIGGDAFQPNPAVASWTLLNFEFHIQRHTSTASATRTLYPCTVVDGLPHMVTIVANSLTSWQVYVDGVEQPGRDRASVDLDPAFDNTSGMWIGPPGTQLDLVVGGGSVLWNTPFWGLEGWTDEFTVHGEALTADQVAALYAAASRIGDGDTTGERIHRVLDLIDWPEHRRLIDTGTVTMSPDYLYGESVWTYLQKVETTEGGRLFMGPHGEVVFHDAARVNSRQTDPVLFDDTGAGVSVLGEAFEVTTDPQFLFTGASVKRQGGLEQQYRDDTAVAARGVKDWTATLLTRTDVEARMRAIGVVERYKDPRPRLSGWRTAPEKTPADWPRVLDVRLGDTVRVTVTLLGTGDTFDEYLDVSSIRHQLTGGGWTVAYEASPQSPGVGLQLEWDASADVGWNYGEWS